MKKVIVYLTVLAMMLALCGCFGEPAPSAEPSTQPTTQPTTLPTTEPTTEPTTIPTTEPVLDAFAVIDLLDAAVSGKVMTANHTEMVMDCAISFSLNQFNMDMDISMNAVQDNLACAEPYRYYTSIETESEIMGMTNNFFTQSYTVLEEGHVVRYTYEDIGKTWTREVLNVPAVMPTDSYAPLKSADNLSLDEATQIIEGREAWVLRFELSMDDMDILSGRFDDLLGASGMGGDLADYVRLQYAVYVDTETHYPLQIIMDVQGMEQYLEDTLFDSSETVPGPETSFLVNAFSVTITGISYDPVEIPPVPQAAYDYVAMSSHDPDQGDGTYLLINSDTAALVTTPAGWEGFASNFNSVEFNTEDYSYWVGFTLYANVTPEDMEAQFNEQVTFYRDIEDYAAHGIEDLEGYRVGWIEDIYGYTRYFAWTQMGTGCLYLTIDDYKNADMAQLLTPLLQAAEYQEPIA